MNPKPDLHRSDRETEPLAAALARLRRNLSAAEPPTLPSQLARKALRAPDPRPIAPRAAPRSTTPSLAAPWTGPLPSARGAGRWAWRAAAVAAVALIASVLLMMQAPPLEQPSSGADLRMAGFVPLLPPERWPDRAEPAAAAWIVPAELSRERLGWLGLPFDPGPAAAPVPAELLVHVSGEVLAVRLLR